MKIVTLKTHVIKLYKYQTGEAYANGTAFCAAQNFLVSENADCFKFDPKVFGHSHRVCPMTLQLLVLVVYVCLRLCPVSVIFHA